MKQQDNSTDKVALLHNKVRSCLKQGLTDDAIIEKLQEEKLERYYIEIIIENIRNEASDRKSFINSIIMGAFFIICGLLINILSYRVSENRSSSSFLLFWGIVVTGVVTIVRGFILYRK
ncbi:MAG: hypothetical protein IPP72_12950 [Chitinophagaceae bacterium]|nr:hypothetical protein [Chitinophagaceae bacterium]